VNRVGIEAGPNQGIEFWGSSFVAAPNGEILARAGREEETLIVPIDTRQVEFARTHWPFLRDRRVEAYGDLTKRWIGD
jgi:N-carbamoylputrescine amidase